MNPIISDGIAWEMVEVDLDFRGESHKYQQRRVEAQMRARLGSQYPLVGDCVIPAKRIKFEPARRFARWRATFYVGRTA